MKAKGISLVWIVVKNLDEAIAFYTEIVGLKLEEKSEEFGWAELKGEEGAYLGLAQASDESGLSPGTNAIFTLDVDSLDEAKKKYEADGVTMIGDVCEVPGHVRLQLCKDRDGNAFQLVETLAQSD